jgi:hypothetical protein
MIRTVCHAVILVLGLAMLSAAPARAAVAPSRVRTETERDRNLRLARKLLREERVRERLTKMGMKPEEIEARLERMNDEELARLAEKLDSIAVGRNGVGIAVALLVIAALVLLIIYLAERV